ncbi:hypothetical protein DES53_115165 [Roseimicrobium gellanilyticum]|uniref:Low affinity Fe/Cu permease n=1 Tax=Roseimicrobium gellanilyticum TaxID=748857 RepID=A0A366H4T4_9BACT|nr:hypothetical protein [Roseimicrobium gellanilyticum]RBP37024.1 hypothetical protein DES53_115165 [Roseimicrobium gellanilyticum]
MRILLIAVLQDWHEHGKAMLASGVATVAMLGDIASDAKSWEDVSLKVLLLIAVVFLVRLLLRQQAEHKAESAAREQRMLETLNRTAEGMEALTALIQEQTDYFKSVVKSVVSERLQTPRAEPPTSVTKQS